MYKSTQRGFTLIELVVVIVILGILAAFAVPRFMGLEKQARIATVNSLMGSVRASASLARSVQLASGLTPNDSISLDGVATPITMSNGYPTTASIANTLQDTTGFNYVPASGLFHKTGVTVPATCGFTYAPPAAAGGAPVFAADVSGC